MSETWSKIKCPYCFKEFSHDEVHFRIAKTTCDMAEQKMRKASSDEEKKVYEKFLRKRELDEKYEKVWGRYRGGNAPKNIEDSFHLPWVAPSNKKEMIHGDFIKDEDGFVYKIEDRLGQTISTYRICPECHNPLPPNYGKFPQKFISILGISNSGKTVFIKQLISGFKDILAHVDGSSTGVTSLDDDYSKIECHQPLPKATEILNFKPPYALTATFKKNGVTSTYDFIIYDIAGEALVKAKDNQLDYFAGYIKVSDGMIMLIDPEQLMSNPKHEYPADQMFDTLNTLFNGNKIEIPMAVTISKSDLILSDSVIQEQLNPENKYLNTNSEINKNIPWDAGKKYFYKDIYSRLSGQLGKFFSERISEVDAHVGNNTKKAAYFAVSALKNGVDQKLSFVLKSTSEWKSSDIDSFTEKFPILKKEFNYIKKALEDQEKNPNENIIDTNEISAEVSFVFEQNAPVIKKLKRFFKATEDMSYKSDIKNAFDVEFFAEEKIKLDENTVLTSAELFEYIWHRKDQSDKYKFEIPIQGYPRNTAQLATLRIEEPLLWILSELKIIKSGNYYENNPIPVPKERWWQKILKN